MSFDINIGSDMNSSNIFAGQFDPSLMEGFANLTDTIISSIGEVTGLEKDALGDTYIGYKEDIHEGDVIKNPTFYDPEACCFEKNKSPNQVSKDLREGEAFLFQLGKENKEGKRKLYGHSKKRYLADRDLEIHQMKNGRKKVSVINRDDFVMITFTDAQYAKITKAAIYAFNNIAETYKDHQKKNGNRRGRPCWKQNAYTFEKRNPTGSKRKTS